jgi:predicted HTH domain antitoxin
MTVQLDLPEDVASAFTGEDLSRAVLESLALEGYRSGRLSEEQVRRMLGFESRFQVHEFLKQHDAYLNYTMEDLEQDLEAAKRFSQQ